VLYATTGGTSNKAGIAEEAFILTMLRVSGKDRHSEDKAFGTGDALI
jgi:hypothetical protein